MKYNLNMIFDFIKKYHRILKKISLKKQFILFIFFLICITLFSQLIFLSFKIKSNLDLGLSIAYYGILGSASLTVLTFTYALVLDYPERIKVISSGKNFFTSTLFFMIGIVCFIITSGEQNNILNIPEIIFDLFNSLTSLFLILLGVILLYASSIYFALGIAGLLNNLIK
ncbi:MAG: hypothetical protein KAI67_01795 [Candidatus Pacebacteria bacterium]|nr:hypothetical protein [Candidatus Paceibacterota bacterium]